jgi:hypothetical protein
MRSFFSSSLSRLVGRPTTPASGPPAHAKISLALTPVNPHLATRRNTAERQMCGQQTVNSHYPKKMQEDAFVAIRIRKLPVHQR